MKTLGFTGAAFFLVTVNFTAIAVGGSKAHFPDPVKSALISVPLSQGDQVFQISFTDCMEISLFRITQMIFADPNNAKNMDLAGLKKMSSKDDLIKFFTKYSRILPGEDYNAKGMMALRSEWALLLSNRAEFSYKKYGQFELLANWDNFVTFFKVFFRSDEFPISGKKVDDEEDLDKLCRFLSHSGFSLECTLKEDRYLFNSGESLYLETHIYFLVNKRNSMELNLIEDFRAGVRFNGHAELY